MFIWIYEYAVHPTVKYMSHPALTHKAPPIILEQTTISNFASI